MRDKAPFFLILLFFLIQIPSLSSLYPADEHIYFYMGKVVSEGARPYIDFFHPHPQVQIYLYALIIKLFGFHIWLLKLITLLFNIGTAIILYFFVRERRDKKTALYSLFIFLTSYQILVHGTFSYGVEISMFFFMWCLWFLNRNPLLCGLFYSLMVMTRLHFVVLGIVLFFFVKNKKKFLLGLIPLTGFYLFMLTVPNFVSNVLMFHAAKQVIKVYLLKFLLMQSYLLALFLMYLKYRKDNLIVWLVAVQLLFFLLVKVVFAYYFVILVLLFSIAGGLAVSKSKYRNHMLVFVVAYFFVINLPIHLDMPKKFPTLDNVSAEINKYEGDIVGRSGIIPLIALKSGKEIKNLQIDTNNVYTDPYNYSDSLVIEKEGMFNIPSCKFLFLINDSTIPDSYGVWDCK